MSTELITTQQVVDDQTLLSHLDNLGLTSKLNQGEKNTFLQIAKAYNLNPFKREIHVSKYGDQMSIITGYEVYIKRAERSGKLDGWSAKTTGSVANNDLKATVTIYRKDRQHPFEWEANYNEFVQTTREGVPTKFWQKADFMIKKVAISQAFRLCFSDELGGMPYTKEEMPETEDTTAEVVHNAAPQKSTPVIIKSADELPKGKQKVSDKAFDDAVERIGSGEHGLIKKLKDNFTLNKKQEDKLVEIENRIAEMENLGA